MNVYSIIYENIAEDSIELVEKLGFGDAATVDLRKQEIQKFIEQHGSWDETLFHQWVKSNISFPSFTKMVSSATEAVYNHAKNGFVAVSDEIHSARTNCCGSCEFLSDSFRCSVCGCYMKVKLKWESSRCPLGKW